MMFPFREPANESPSRAHLPPRPDHAAYFLVTSAAIAAASFVAWALLGVGNPLRSALRVISFLGASPGLLAWQIFGRTGYRLAPRSASDSGGRRGTNAPIESDNGRLFLINGEDLPFSAIARAPSEADPTDDVGHVLCLRYPEAMRWLHPVSLLQYGAVLTGLWVYFSAGYHYEVCLVLPAIIVASIVWFSWALARGPWAVIDFEPGGVWFDETCAGFGRGLQRPRVVAAALRESKRLRLILDTGRAVHVVFPGGSLPRETQATIVVELLRARGIV